MAMPSRPIAAGAATLGQHRGLVDASGPAQSRPKHAGEFARPNACARNRETGLRASLTAAPTPPQYLRRGGKCGPQMRRAALARLR